MDAEMYVTKRSGERHIVAFDKILQRIKKIGQEVDIKINYTTLAMKVIDQLYDGISTTKIDELSAEQCASMASIRTDYNTLAGRIVVSNHHKNTSASFSEVMSNLYHYRDKHDKPSPLLSHELFELVQKHGVEFDEMCDYSRDYLIDYFGFKTLERAYMMKIDKKTVERPQHMWLRVSIGIHGDNMPKIRETYEYMSQKYFTHATPTLFNSGTPHPQLSSCFLLAMENDSIEGIYNTLKDCALISKWAGGIGLHIHNVRASGSHIRGTNGSSNGIGPMLRVFNNTAKYVDQCLHPDTILYTTRGPIPISRCIAQYTQILNIEGGNETVKKTLEYSYNGTMLEISIKNKSIPPLRITPEHPIYILADYAHVQDTAIQADLTAGTAKFAWIEAKDVSTTDLLVYPIPQYEQDSAELTNEICYFYGVMLAGLLCRENSTLIQSYGGSATYGFGIYFENPVEPNVLTHLYNFLAPPDNTVKKTVKTLSKIDEFCNFLTGRCIQYVTMVVGNYTRVSWDKMNDLPYNTMDFRDTCDPNKSGFGQRWLYLPVDKINFIISGLGEMAHHKSIANVMFFLNLRRGIIYETLTKPGTNELIPSKKIISFRHQNNLLVRIHTINDSWHEGVVYDLQMFRHHNYLVEGGLVHNGGGKRNGSFAIYLEPWHADIELFLQMRKNHGDEELKARDLFYALWMPDLFMERVKSDGDWTLMCPDECPGLSDVYGEKFVELYTKYETQKKGRNTMKARALWFQILDAQMETGTPYLLYKDAANRKSNQKNVGIIKSSNLCSEIIQYSDENETAVCNLASIGLPTFVEYPQKMDKIDNSSSAGTGLSFNFEKLHKVTRMITYNLNRIIDVNYYPTEKTRTSNMRHRPIGIGVQGLADVFMMMNQPFASDESKQLNRDIFETIYHAALTESCELAKREGPYETFYGSPASKGELQFDLWNVDMSTSTRYDWFALKLEIQNCGLRNSLLLAPMPTASTSQILGFNECIEPITSNIYSRRTIAGEFIMANKYLMNDLIELGLWNDTIKTNIIANNGSVQHISTIPPEIREKFKTVWEIPMKHIIDMAADRGAFICQSQSLNLWQEDPSYGSLTSMHFYAWNKGLKTGMYYLRRRGKHQAQQFTVEPKKGGHDNKTDESEEICEMCSA
jgi:ribonucleoside-diphosphate reductase alpha subunit